jgi:hypothetical protein
MPGKPGPGADLHPRCVEARERAVPIFRVPGRDPGAFWGGRYGGKNSLTHASQPSSRSVHPSGVSQGLEQSSRLPIDDPVHFTRNRGAARISSSQKGSGISRGDVVLCITLAPRALSTSASVQG